MMIHDNIQRVERRRDDLFQLLEDAFKSLPINVLKLEDALEKGAAPNQSILGGCLPLHLAVRARSVRALEILLAHPDIDSSLTEEDGESLTAHGLAAKRGWKEGVSLIQQWEPSSQAPENHREDLQKAFISTLRFENEPHLFVDYYLSRGADPSTPNASGMTPLFFAVMNLDKRAVTLLLKAGADLSYRTPEGLSALDMIWHMSPHQRLSATWHAMFDFLIHQSGGDLFSENPENMTFKALSAPVPCLDNVQRRRESKKPFVTFIHWLAEAGRFDVVMKAFKAAPEARLSQELLLSEGTYRPLINTLRDKQQLKEVFNPKLWIGRVEEMQRVLEAIKPSYAVPMEKIDMDAIVQETRMLTLKQNRSKIKIKVTP